MDRLTRRGRTVRVAAAATGLALLLAGTLWGQDDDFPFGPFRMYSTAPAPDEDAPNTRLEGVDSTGRTIQLTENNSGLRRAEIEGQEQAYVDDPARLRQVALAYAARTPGVPPLREVRIVVHWVGIEHSRPTGTGYDQVVARWAAP